ncbi:hypothetical protein TIFTF001_034631 [Ficus carica]|uniref:Uncharacterized protein n=1 Tax=Ficus carica TaxID=3494 RepID=A0AA88E428_FICCA|nr:hypothetical protein TIFTF001_034631 [Ficus carica]
MWQLKTLLEALPDHAEDNDEARNGEWRSRRNCNLQSSHPKPSSVAVHHQRSEVVVALPLQKLSRRRLHLDMRVCQSSVALNNQFVAIASSRSSASVAQSTGATAIAVAENLCYRHEIYRQHILCGEREKVRKGED